MLSIRRAQERGHSDLGWLNSFHTFSFGQYHDRRYMGFSALRVINDDTVAPGRGFDSHEHRDMEIISVVLSGALDHKDSMGNGSTIHPGEVQRMSAGTGVSHSEFNASPDEPVHFLQIWIIPAREGIKPGYEQRAFSLRDRQGRLCLVASPSGEDGAVTLHQDMNLYWTTLAKHDAVVYSPIADRNTYIHIATGRVNLNDQALEAGDGVALAQTKRGPSNLDSSAEQITLSFSGLQESEVLIFDLP